MKGIVNFLAVVVVMMVVSVLPAPMVAMAQEQEWFVYQPRGEKCEMADLERDIYVNNGGSLPPELRKTLAKCGKYAKAATAQKKQSAGKSHKLIGFFK